MFSPRALFPLDEECPTEPAAQERAERPPPSATHAAVAALLQPSPEDQAVNGTWAASGPAGSVHLDLCISTRHACMHICTSGIVNRVLVGSPAATITRSSQPLPHPPPPPNLSLQLYNAALMAVQASSGSLELTAQMLARLGYAVTLNTSAGGTLHSLKHRYLTATRTSLAGS